MKTGEKFLKFLSKTVAPYGKYLLLIIIPCVLSVLYVVSSHARGPYYLGPNSDPEYAYLLNSLRIAELRAPSHIHHPGTTLQMIGAGMIKLINLGKNDDDMVKEVVSHPEKYLNYISVVLVCLLVAVEMFVGFVAFKNSNNIAMALILQLTPLMSTPPLQELYRVRPDNLLIPVSLLFSLLAFLTLCHPFNKANTAKYIYSFAIVSGFAMVTKIIFFPLLIIPLVIIPRFFNKFKFILFAFLAFVIFSVPIIPQYPALLKWVLKLYSHSDLYGLGENRIINPKTFFGNISSIITGEWIMTIVLIVIVIIAGRMVVGWVRKKKMDYDERCDLPFAIGLALISQILMVSKHMSFHYLIPGLMLMGLAVIVVIPLLAEHLSLKMINVTLLVLIVSFALAVNIRDFQKVIENLNAIRLEHVKLLSFTADLPKDARRISYYGNSSQAYALSFGNNFSDRIFSPILKNIYPNEIFYSIWEKQFSDFEKKISVESVMQSQNPTYFQGISFNRSGYKGVYKPSLNLVDIYNGKGETVYRLEGHGF